MDLPSQTLNVPLPARISIECASATYRPAAEPAGSRPSVHFVEAVPADEEVDTAVVTDDELDR
jgi:hypothetical protein